MISTGNDIVSLSAINIARTKQPAFYSKILSETEIEKYKQVGIQKLPFENYIWLLWSIKESAYKYLQRTEPGLVFSPTKFVVSGLKRPVKALTENFDLIQQEGNDLDEIKTWNAKVTIGPYSLFSKSQVYTNLLLSVVNHTEDFENVYWGVQTIDDTNPEVQSALVRVFLLNKLSAFLTNKKLKVRKSKHGFPLVFEGKSKVQLPVSLSHHDHFIAYSFYYDAKLNL